jgi:hypothetical protein
VSIGRVARVVAWDEEMKFESTDAGQFASVPEVQALIQEAQEISRQRRVAAVAIWREKARRGEAMKRYWGLMCWLLVLVLMPIPALADRFHMKSGFDFDVDAWREDGDELVYERFGGEVRIKKADVARIERREERVDTSREAPGVATTSRGHAADGPRTLRGTATLITTRLHGSGRRGDDCRGARVGRGTQVVVTNQDGRVIGTGVLGQGSFRDNVSCVFEFKVLGLPPATFYGIDVEGHARGIYSVVDLEVRRWAVEFLLEP